MVDPLSCLCRGGKVRTGGWSGRRRAGADANSLILPGASPKRAPEFEHHLDECAFEPVAHGEVVGGLVEFGHETIGIGLGGDRVGMHGWKYPWVGAVVAAAP